MQEETDMRRMIWFEWKRIWQSRLTQFAAAGGIPWPEFCGIIMERIFMMPEPGECRNGFPYTGKIR